MAQDEMVEFMKSVDNINLEDSDDDNNDIIRKSDDVCINCESVNKITLDNAKGYYVCTVCGSVQKNILDMSEVQVGYSDGNNEMHYGAVSNPHFPKSSLGTRISGNYSNILVRMHNWNAVPYNERTLWNTYNQIEGTCKRYGIPNNIIFDSKQNYYKISQAKHLDGKKKITRGSNSEGLKGVSVYYACKKNNYPISTKEVEKMFNLKKKLSKACKIYEKLLNFDTSIQKELVLSTAEDYIEYFCKKLSIGEFYCKLTQIISVNAEKIDIVCEHTPQSIATGCIFFMVKLKNLNLTKKQISEGCGKSDVTITKLYKKMIPYTQYLMPSKEEHDKLVEEFKGTREFNLKPNFLRKS
jgi:transcription initiation factor TFIIIB Brf1 subunit/transcription initiation factor TFIIB